MLIAIIEMLIPSMPSMVKNKITILISIECTNNKELRVLINRPPGFLRDDRDQKRIKTRLHFRSTHCVLPRRTIMDMAQPSPKEPFAIGHNIRRMGLPGGRVEASLSRVLDWWLNTVHYGYHYNHYCFSK